MLRTECAVLRRTFGRERARGQWVRNWRVLTAIAAVVLAALAGVLVWKYTDDAKQDAKKPYKFVTVLVASKNVSANTSFGSALKSKLIERTDRVRDSVPETYINGTLNDQVLAKNFGEKVASHDIVEGQTIVASDFTTSGQVASGLSGTLSTDEAATEKAGAAQKLQAISIAVDDPHAVAGMLSPGDRVNVIATVDIKDPTSKDKTPVKTTAYLIPGLKVVAVGNTTTATQTAEANGETPTTEQSNVARGIVTLEVTSRQGLQLAHMQNGAGTITLTLLPSTFKPGDFKDDEEVAEAANLFDQPLPITDRLLQQLAASAG